MLTKDFSFELPDELIAQVPADTRGTSRMLVLDTPDTQDAHTRTADYSIKDIAYLIPAGTVMIVNNSRVRRARLDAETAHGGAVEVLLLQPQADSVWEVMLSKSKRRRIGEQLQLPGGCSLQLLERLQDGTWLARTEPEIDDDYLEKHGRVPLPPYIRRMHLDMDLDRYQTVYAAETGSVAAPTAGLHFTPEILDRMRRNGVEIHEITLHVGLGTFLPVRSESITDHRMHKEDYSISDTTAAAVEKARAQGRPVLAVGTTSVRALESSWSEGSLRRGSQSTAIFIYPGYRFQVVDMLLTNFHTPESTLLMLVSALAGRERILAAYREAVDKRYRFFSYGDAMLINTWSRPLLQTQP